MSYFIFHTETIRLARRHLGRHKPLKYILYQQLQFINSNQRWK